MNPPYATYTCFADAGVTEFPIVDTGAPGKMR